MRRPVAMLSIPMLSIPMLSIHVLCLICILGLSDQKLWDCLRFVAHARSIKRMMLGTSILETKLIAIIFKVSFDHAYVLAIS